MKKKLTCFIVVTELGSPGNHENLTEKPHHTLSFYDTTSYDGYINLK